MSAWIRKLGVLVANKGCNANCTFCAGKQHRTQNDFNFERFQMILIENEYVEEISISGGGEPLLQPNNIENTLFSIKQLSLPKLKKVKLYTNGILLNDSIEKLKFWKMLGLTHLYITVHNVDPKKSQITLKSAQLPPTMEEIVEIGKLTGLSIRINIPLFKEGISTINDLYNMRDHLLKVGLDNISYWVVRDNTDKRDSELSSIFNLEEPVYDQTKQTLFPNGELRFDWCN